jgi:hypothetical protein
MTLGHAFSTGTLLRRGNQRKLVVQNAMYDRSVCYRELSSVGTGNWHHRS